MAEWARAVAVPIDQALVLCAFVVLTASFVGWILALLPPSALVPVFCLLLVAGVVVPPVAARMGDPALPLARPADTMRRLVSVTWLPLLGFAVYAFMTDVMAHSAFGVVQASFLGGAVAALVMFGVCFLWGRTPLLPWSYRILVSLMAAAFVVLGAFPAGTFPRDASVVALYVFYIVLALLGCAVLLAVVRNRELPANVASGFACGVAAAAALLGQILSQVLTVTDDFAPWLAVLTGAFVAVLLVFLGRTSWNELVAPRESAAAEEPALAARSGHRRRPWRGCRRCGARRRVRRRRRPRTLPSPPSVRTRPAMFSSWPSRAHAEHPGGPLRRGGPRPAASLPARPRCSCFWPAASRRPTSRSPSSSPSQRCAPTSATSTASSA